MVYGKKREHNDDDHVVIIEKELQQYHTNFCFLFISASFGLAELLEYLFATQILIWNFRLLVQFWCSYSTLPLNVIITQVWTNFKFHNLYTFFLIFMFIVNKYYHFKHKKENIL